MAKAERARYSVQIAWKQGAIGLFTMGTSQLNGPDTLAASAWSQTFKGTYDDVTQPGDGTHVDEIHITRGRETDLGATSPGEATIVLVDPRGKFNARNPASPIYGDNRPRRPIRIVATYAGVAYPLYYGWTDRIDWQAGKRSGKATIFARDLMSRMETRTPVLTSSGPTTIGAQIGRMLDTMQWTDPVMRRLATGDLVPDFSANLDSNAGKTAILSLIDGLLLAERGFFFMGNDGAAVYVSRDQRARELSVATLTNVMRNMVVASDVGNITNRWTITRTSLAGAQISQQVFTDQPSVDLYDVFDDALSTAYLWDDNTMVNLGAYLLSKTAQPLRPSWALPLRANLDAATMVQALARDLNDRVTINEGHLGTVGDYFIEQIVHDITLGGLHHETTWRMTERPTVATGPFRLGVSQLNGADQLDYYP